MDMVGHYDEVNQIVSIPIEVMQTLRDDRCRFDIAKWTCPVTLIQQRVPTIATKLPEFSLKF